MMTAEQYRASLNDGRETYFGGEQIFDLPGHPILGQTVESAARGYARFYDPKPGAVGAFMKIPGSAQELREQVELHESVDLLTHVTYASIMTLLTAADRIEATLPENAARIRAYVKDAQERDVRITQCITDAKGDRSRRPGSAGRSRRLRARRRSARPTASSSAARSCTSRRRRWATS